MEQNTYSLKGLNAARAGLLTAIYSFNTSPTEINRARLNAADLTYGRERESFIKWVGRVEIAMDIISYGASNPEDGFSYDATAEEVTRLV